MSKAHRPTGDTLSVACWCEADVLDVPDVDVREGRTLSCGRPGCRPPGTSSDGVETAPKAPHADVIELITAALIAVRWTNDLEVIKVAAQQVLNTFDDFGFDVVPSSVRPRNAPTPSRPVPRSERSPGTAAWYSPEEAADVLGVARSTVYKMLRASRFPTEVRRLNRRWRIMKDPLDEYLS